MYVSKIRMQNFRCYTDFTMHFSPGVTVIVAENGKGKTAILDGLAINKLDTLSGIGDLKICVGYQKPDGTKLRDFPSSLEELAECAPIYEEFPGFDDDISQCRKFEDLPETCRKYIERLEELCECKVCMVGVGPDREQQIERR